MSARGLGIGVAAVMAVAAVALVVGYGWPPGAAAALRAAWGPGAVAQAPAPAGRASGPGARVIPVAVTLARRKQVPVQIEALGTVTPIAGVAIKARLETEIVGVHFADGAFVNKGDLLFTLDSRALQAQVRQAEASLARSRAQLEGAERDVRRYTELVAKSATPVTNLDNAKTQAEIFRAAIAVDQALIDNLRVQLSYATIRAPISGRIGTAAVKVGNFVRPADTASLATIIQMAPVYLTFPVAQRNLADIRHALAGEAAKVEALTQGGDATASGHVTLIENMVDMATGMATVRATMPNADALLWPGTLVGVKLTLREEEAITIPTEAVQVGQGGAFVFVVKDAVARVRPIKVERVFSGDSVIAAGLAAGETVVTDGHLLLSDGARVAPRGRPAGA
ncbi:MAG: efflux RND transporter periplasmic adaptor subunit [Proteobacteria bacterium]|nr:efflux RND transporter periplasmic adaptor subunit [Pseudomonadota bacterium]